ncbi:MAG: GGDEF domain-containing protein [Synergistaceae bacterium]|nr:GGDEF domain-containing protein [Synergistaceae bacterium]
MSTASAVVRAWNESAAVFGTAGYAIFNIEAQIVCAAVLIILFSHQQTVSDQSEERLYWTRLMFVQILYCVSAVLRVLADVDIISDAYSMTYIVTALNFIFLTCACWLTFVYTELCQKSELIRPLINKIISAVPLLFNVIMLIVAPFSGAYINFSRGFIKIGLLSPFMLAIGPGYLLLAAVLAMYRRGKMTRYERDTTHSAAFYPGFLFFFLTVQLAFNWRIPLFCSAQIIANVIVYMLYTNSLVSVDPLTKIPNRNGMIKELSESLIKLNTSEEISSSTLYLFAVDVDGLSILNANYGQMEGNKVLIVIASALKKFRNEAHKCYISRYYGDEFFLIAEIPNDEERDLFIEHIRNYISNASTDEGLSYHIRVNIGFAKYEKYSRTETISGLIEEARRSLGENKEQRKFQSIWHNKN